MIETVSDLIKRLQEYPQDMLVATSDTECGVQIVFLRERKLYSWEAESLGETEWAGRDILIL